MDAPVSAARRRYAFILGCAINFFVFAFCTAALPVLFSEIAAELGLSIVQVGAVWGASSAAGIVSIIAAGLLADRYGVRRVLALLCVMAGVFGALRGFSTSLGALIGTSILFGLAAEAVPVVVVKSTSQWYRDRSLGTAQGILTACVGGGLMTGAALSATVVSPWLGGWHHVLLAYGGVSVFLGLLWFATATAPPAISSPDIHMRPPASYRTSLGRVARSRSVWLIALAMMGFAGSNKSVMGYLPLYLRDAGWTPASADGALAALNAAGTAGAVPFMLLSDRLNRRKTVLMPALAVSAAGILLLTWTTGPAAWLLAVMVGLFRDMIWAIAATMAVEAEGIGPENAGTAVGLVHSLTRLGYTFAPPAGNALAATAAGAPFLVWTGLSALAIVFFWLVPEKRNRPLVGTG
jgi:MFS family permease